MKVPDHLPADQDLGDPRGPTDVLNRMVADISAVIDRYMGAVDEAQVLGALDIIKGTVLRMMWERE